MSEPVALHPPLKRCRDRRADTLGGRLRGWRISRRASKLDLAGCSHWNFRGLENEQKFKAYQRMELEVRPALGLGSRESGPVLASLVTGETIDTDRGQIKRRQALAGTSLRAFRPAAVEDLVPTDVAPGCEVLDTSRVTIPEGKLRRLTAPTRKSWDITSAWGVDPDGTVRLITATP